MPFRIKRFGRGGGDRSNNARNFKDLREIRGSAKSLNNSERERKGILIAPLKRPPFFTVTESLSSWTFTHCLEQEVGFGPKSRGTNGKPTINSQTEISVSNQREL